MTITGKTTNTFNLFGSIKESTLYCTMLKGYGYNKVQYEIITLQTCRQTRERRKNKVQY